MFGRVQAQSRAIRGASNAMREYASRAAHLPIDTTGAERAVSGFMSAAAAEHLADDIRADMDELDVHLVDTAEVLDDLAAHWDHADAATAADFERIAASLHGRPGD
ncbi:hypothetical protein O1R50_18840 [Glycomyces luteolus]|uniref:Uncharacterized protein n=1 Tax=Glycomyces luteolus TaxID=2670330 RepID=A0A9X3SRI3_9ACTN|nr:hypothetical protein [Glycomyces luteolus]MDA1361692.1 hypothetical protein [Glycomyces luteolus]